MNDNFARAHATERSPLKMFSPAAKQAARTRGVQPRGASANSQTPSADAVGAMHGSKVRSNGGAPAAGFLPQGMLHRFLLDLADVHQDIERTVVRTTAELASNARLARVGASLRRLLRKERGVVASFAQRAGCPAGLVPAAFGGAATATTTTKAPGPARLRRRPWRCRRGSRGRPGAAR